MPKLFRSTRLTLLILFKYLKRRWRLSSLIAISILALIFLQTKVDIFALNTNTLKMGFVGTYQEHDIPVEVTKLVSTGLTESNNEGRVVAKLASGWDTNNDATEFTFRLKKDLYWSDGTAVKSKELEFNIPSVEISYPDDQTVRFKLKEPYSPFPSLLVKPVFKKGTLVGIGPYKITSVEKSRIFITKINLEPLNKDLPQIVIRFYPNEKIALSGFMLGEIQALSGVASKQLLENPSVKLNEKTDFSKIVSIFYNTTDQLLSNRSFRQALTYSTPKIDKEEVAENPYPYFWWAYNKEHKNYLGNSDKAKEALDRAKSSSSDDLIKKELTLTTTPQLEEVGKQILNSWKKLGVNGILRVESGRPQNFQALLITQSIPPDPDQYFLWHATQVTTNLSKYDSKRADKDLEDGRKKVREEERKDSYFDFQKVLLEDSPATFLYFPKYNVFYLKKVENKLNQVLSLGITR